MISLCFAFWTPVAAILSEVLKLLSVPAHEVVSEFAGTFLPSQIPLQGAGPHSKILCLIFFNLYLCPTLFWGDWLAFSEVWGFLPGFRRFSVRTVPQSDIVLMYLWGGSWSPILLLHHLESLLWNIMTQTWAFESWSPCCLVQHATIHCFDRQRRPVWETASYPCSFPWRCGVALEAVCERHLEEFASPTPFEFPVLFISELGFMTGFCFFFNWSIVDLQCYVNFRCTAKWFIDTYLYVVFFFFFQILLPFRLL